MRAARHSDKQTNKQRHIDMQIAILDTHIVGEVLSIIWGMLLTHSLTVENATKCPLSRHTSQCNVHVKPTIASCVFDKIGLLCLLRCVEPAYTMKCQRHYRRQCLDYNCLWFKLQ